MKFLGSFVLFVLFLNNFSTAQTLIRDSCKKVAANDPDMNYDFCVKSLESDPQSKTATSLLGLLIASTKNAASNTIYVNGIAQKILNNAKTSPGFKASLRVCIELYSDAIDCLNTALTDAKSHDYSSLNENLSAAFDAPSDCEDAFKEDKQAKSPITNQYNVLTQRILIPLAFSNMV